MDTRTAYDYAKPSTLIAIIADAIDHVNEYTSPASLANVKQITADAWEGLVANAGLEEAVEMACDAGISMDTLEELTS